MQRILAKNFNNFKGLDNRSSDLVRDADSAASFKNIRVTKEDSCTIREGFNARSGDAQYEGLVQYVWSDVETGETEQELISLSDGLYRRLDLGLTVTYSGSSVPCFISIFLDTTTATFKCQIVEGGATVLDYDLGTGFEDTPISVSDLNTVIDGVSNFSASNSDSAAPAAFLAVTLQADLSSGSKTQEIAIYDWEVMSTINTAPLSSTPFASYHTNRGNSAWELASCVNINNCLYVATGYEYLHKYDGQNVYRAGLPEAPQPTTFVGGTGYTDTNVRYIFHYTQIDNRGNTVKGIESDPSIALSPANETVTVVCPTIQPGDGFNTGCANVNGDQTGVTTILVYSANTLKVGDTAFFLDGVTAENTERVITARTDTTISIEGDPVNVSNNDVISNNLRITIYRSTNGGNLFYLVAEIPNQSIQTTITLSDAIATADLGIQYLPPTKDRDILSIKPKYLREHQGLLIAAGSIEEPNTWYFSSGEGPEYFPAETNFEDVRATSGGGIRGLASDQEHLIIGTERDLYVVTGDIDAGTARQEKLQQGNIGFSCHNSICDVNGAIIFLSRTGFYRLENGFNLTEVGNGVNSAFNTTGLPASQTPQFRRACAVHFEEAEEYICFVPCESGSGTGKFANSNSRAYVFDAFHESWGEWTNLNMGGGLAIFENNIFFQSKRDNSGPVGNLWERKRLGTVDDYADHHEVIDLEFTTQWMNAGEPSVFKVFLWLKVYNLLRSILAPTFTLHVSVERDYQKDLPWFEFDLDFGGGTSSMGWGYFPWGYSSWGSPRFESIKKKLKSGKAQALRYKFTCAHLHQRVSLSAWETELTAPYSTELKQ